MKLLQYRFAADDFREASYVGGEVILFFSGINDLNLDGIFSAIPKQGGIERRHLQPHSLSLVVAESFQQSYLVSRIDYQKYASIKSSASCRFLVFESDGLLRICYSSDDNIIEFKKLSPQITDESPLLIKTDLFDFL